MYTLKIQNMAEGNKEDLNKLKHLVHGLGDSILLRWQLSPQINLGIEGNFLILIEHIYEKNLLYHNTSG